MIRYTKLRLTRNEDGVEWFYYIQVLLYVMLISLMGTMYSQTTFAQNLMDDELNTKPIKEFTRNSSDEKVKRLKETFSLFTGVPEKYEHIAYIAISYFPELKKVPIKLVLTKTKWPLTSQPFFSDILFPFKQRRYRIIVSEESGDELNDVLLKSLPFDAQIGAIGHELAHIADYQQKKGLALAALGISYWAGYNRMKVEHSADKTTIDHGLGYQLYHWSTYVRKVMGNNDWVIPNKEFKEIYTSPSEILAMIHGSPLYQQYVHRDNCQAQDELPH